MELRAYWAIIWRRLWLIAFIVGIVALYVGYQEYHLRKTPGAFTVYHSNITIQVGLQAFHNSVDPNYANSVIVSEALADALATGPILTSTEFDTQISQQIDADMAQITQSYGAQADLHSLDPGAIGNALNASRVHSLVSVVTTWSTPAGAWAIANAFGEVTSSNICNYLEYIVSKDASCSSSDTTGEPGVAAQIITGPSNPAAAPGDAASKQTTYIILLLIALVLGIALTFLAAYLDDRIYTRDDAAQLLQLPVYGEIPRTPTARRKELSAAISSEPPAIPTKSVAP